MPTIDEAYKEAYALAKPYGVMAMDLRILLMHDEGLHEQIDVLFYKEREMKNIERGQTIPSIATFYRIVSAMGLSVELRPMI